MMNKEEAIEKWVIPALKNTWNEKKCNEVLEALKQEPCTVTEFADRCMECGKILGDMIKSCDDCVSRQAVIDALTKTSGIRGDALKALYDLPPVTPQYTETEIQKMQELEQAEIQKAYELGKAEQPCEDAISRQAVLEAIRKCHCEEWIKADIGASIEALSPVTPAEKVGNWIDVDGIWFKCSECGAHRKMMPAYKEYYCPNCGTKMQEVEE